MGRGYEQTIHASGNLVACKHMRHTQIHLEPEECKLNQNTIFVLSNWHTLTVWQHQVLEIMLNL